MKSVYAIPGVLAGIPFAIHYDSTRFIDEVLIGGEYEKHLGFLTGKTDLTVIDLGCNIGSFSLSIYDRSKKIYAVDLSVACIELLKKTIEDNHLQNIVPIVQAISGENRKVHVTSLENTDGGSTIYGYGEEVDSITLATFMGKNNISHVDVLKIDVECAENEIFLAKDFESVKENIDIIVGECHAGGVCGQILEPLGYYYTQAGPDFLAVRKNSIYYSSVCQ